MVSFCCTQEVTKAKSEGIFLEQGELKPMYLY